MFYVSLLEQNIKRKGQEFSVSYFDNCDDKEYEVKAIQNSVVYTKKTDKHLPELYYLVAWKDYLKEKNTWELSLVFIHL